MVPMVPKLYLYSAHGAKTGPVLAPYGVKLRFSTIWCRWCQNYTSIVPMVPKRVPFWQIMMLKYVLAPYGGAYGAKTISL